MAQNVVVQLVDDIDGTAIKDGSGESINFALDGVSYEIDLVDRNAKKLRDAMAPYLTAARRTGGRARRGQAGRPGPSAARNNNAAMRAWARENDYEVSDRGRISAEIAAAYDAAGK